MTELILERNERLTLRSEAHHITFAVLLGANGLTEAVIKEVDRALAAHGLIKVKLSSDDREERNDICATLADRCNAAIIQIIGKTVVLYRPQEETEENKVKTTPKAEKTSSKSKRNTKKTAKKQPLRKSRPKRKRITKKAALN